MSGNKAITNIDYNNIDSDDIHEPLRIMFDSKLILKDNIHTLWKKLSQKPNDLPRISNYVTFDKRKIIMETLITSQFSYCFFMWMLNSKRLGKNKCIMHYMRGF